MEHYKAEPLTSSSGLHTITHMHVYIDHTTERERKKPGWQGGSAGKGICFQDPHDRREPTCPLSPTHILWNKHTHLHMCTSIHTHKCDQVGFFFVVLKNSLFAESLEPISINENQGYLISP